MLRSVRRIIGTWALVSCLPAAAMAEDWAFPGLPQAVERKSLCSMIDAEPIIRRNIPADGYLHTADQIRENIRTILRDILAAYDREREKAKMRGKTLSIFYKQPFLAIYPTNRCGANVFAAFDAPAGAVEIVPYASQIIHSTDYRTYASSASGPNIDETPITRYFVSIVFKENAEYDIGSICAGRRNMNYGASQYPVLHPQQFDTHEFCWKDGEITRSEPIGASLIKKAD